MKLLKKLFSKIFISGLALILQFALFLSVLLFAEQYFAVLQIVSAVFGIILFFCVISKKESPEFKIPWMFLMLAFPLFGVVVYCMFANSRMPTKFYRRMLESACLCKKYFELTSSENERIKAELGENYGIEAYLRRNAYSRGHLNNRVTYFPSGEEFYEDLLCELEKAQKFIFMEYFIIDHGKMWEGILSILKAKAREGVEVRVMYDDIGCAGLLKSNYRKQLKKFGINCVKFNRFLPVVSGIHNNRDHRKITVIDGKVGYTGGVNLADEYINAVKRFGHWKDTAVKICGPAVGNLTALFLQMFDCTAKSLSNYHEYLDIDYEKFDDAGYINFFGDGPKPIYDEMVGANNYINILNSAKKYAYITTPYLIPDYNLLSALRNAAFRGVDVRIITPHIPDKKIVFNMTRSNYKYLLKSGVKIYEYTPGFIHAKSMIADGQTAFVGTINLDYRSLVHHYECGAVMHGTPCIKNIEMDILGTLEKSQEITAENFKMGIIPSFLNAVLNIFAPML
ncbi:MAG: cardiolipin synthase [Clostridia bacterium]|nr:cardiolipin synthase [Clostridia bacterium]